MGEIIKYIYPVPKHLEFSGDKINCDAIYLSFEKGLDKLMKSIDFEFMNNSPNIASSEFLVKLSPIAKLPLSMKHYEYNEDEREDYGIRIQDKTIEIFVSSDRSLFYALNTLKQMFKIGYLYSYLLIYDYPCMKIRGIIEGYYGRPWSMEDRIEAISTIAEHKMNTYVYAPKSDIYHRDKWFVLYSKRELTFIKRLFEQCNIKKVDFYYTLAPGLSIRYSDIRELAKLFEKYKQLFDIGIRNFGLLFDDIPNELIHKEDKSVFRCSSEAHAFIANKTFEYLKSLDDSCKLIVCPTTYSGRGDEKYITELCRNLPKEVYVFWTGRSICSQELDTRDAQYFYENTKHKPLFWDNYPVNDASMENEMHLGPIINRDKDLSKYSEGLVSNVMEYKECSMIPVITIAHYLWNSYEYYSNESLKQAVLEVAGQRDYEDFLKFAKYCLKSCLNPTSSDEFIEKAVQLKYASFTGSTLQTLETMEDYFRGNIESASRLEEEMENRKLKKEVKRWLQKFLKFNKLCLYAVFCSKYSYSGRMLKAGFMIVKLFSLAGELNRDPTQMMNFETKALMDSVKENIRNRPKLK